jgi:hypothetical protein
MSYIGQQPLNNFVTKQSQEFTPDGSTTGFTLNFAVTSGTDILLMINNVVQEPGAGNAYTASGTTLTMSEAPSASDSMYCIFLGLALQTVNPGDASVGTAKLVDSAVTTAKLDSSLDLSSKTITLASNMKNTPAFSVGLSGNQTIGDAAYTKLQFDLEFFDTDSAFDNSTNYNFTVPSGKAGKYFISASARNTTATDFDSYYLRIQKNNAEWLFSSVRSEFRETIAISDVIDLSVGDTLHLEVYNGSGGNLDISGSSDKPSGTHFSGFKLIE